jgi:hypothetical protein
MQEPPVAVPQVSPAQNRAMAATQTSSSAGDDVVVPGAVDGLELYRTWRGGVELLGVQQRHDRVAEGRP